PRADMLSVPSFPNESSSAVNNVGVKSSKIPSRVCLRVGESDQSGYMIPGTCAFRITVRKIQTVDAPNLLRLDCRPGCTGVFETEIALGLAGYAPILGTDRRSR